MFNEIQKENPDPEAWHVAMDVYNRSCCYSW